VHGDVQYDGACRLAVRRLASPCPPPGAGPSQRAAVHPGGPRAAVSPRLLAPYDQPVWLCHAPQLPLVGRSRLTPNARLLVGLRSARARGLAPCGPGGVSVPLCLARAARQREARRRLLPHTGCLTPGHPDAVDASRILARLSPHTYGALGATPRSRAAIVALRTWADSVAAPRRATEYSR
jgi:hypothetical protein